MKELIKFTVFNGNVYVNCNIMCHNGFTFLKKITYALNRALKFSRYAVGLVSYPFEFKRCFNTSRTENLGASSIRAVIFILRNSRPHFAQRASDLAERAEHFTDWEKKWLLTLFSPLWKYLSKSESNLKLDGVLNSK